MTWLWGSAALQITQCCAVSSLQQAWFKASHSSSRGLSSAAGCRLQARMTGMGNVPDITPEQLRMASQHMASMSPEDMARAAEMAQGMHGRPPGSVPGTLSHSRARPGQCLLETRLDCARTRNLCGVQLRWGTACTAGRQAVLQVRAAAPVLTLGSAVPFSPRSARLGFKHDCLGGVSIPVTRTLE